MIVNHEIPEWLRDRVALGLDMRRSAERAIEINARHSKESLFSLLSAWYPDATESELDSVCDSVF